MRTSVLSKYTVSIVGLALVAGLTGCSEDPAAAKLRHLQAAKTAAQAQKYPEAVLEYKSAIQIDPRMADAHYGLAQAYEAAGDLGSAIREYIRTADLAPDNLDAQIRAGNGLLRSGQYKDAQTRAETILKKDVRNVDAQIMLGNALAGMKDMDKAVSTLEQAAQADTNRPGTFLSLGAVQYASGDITRAEATFKNAVKVAPQAAATHLALANFYWATKRSDEAEAEMKAAAQMDPKNTVVSRALAVFYMSTNRAGEAEPYLKSAAEHSPDPLSAKLMLADYYDGLGKREQAREVLTGLAKREDGYVPATLRLASFDYGAGKKDEAKNTVDAVLKKSPGNAQALATKGGFFQAEKQCDAAIAQYKLAIASDPHFLQPFMQMAECYLEKRDTAQALAAYNEALKLNPGLVPVQLRLAEMHAALGNRDTSIQFAQQVLERQPSNVTARLLLSRGLIAQHELARAQQELNALIAQNPNSALINAELGNLSMTQGRQADAERYYARAVQLDSTNVDALNGLVVIDLSRRKPDAAFARLDDALRRSPNNSKLLLLAAQTRIATGDSRASEELLKKTIAADPQNMRAYSTLGAVYARQGKLAEAQKQFESISAAEPKAIFPRTMAGILYQLQNNPAAAQQAYESVLQLDPRAGVAANNLAYMYASGNGNLDVALRLAQTAKQQLPDDPDVSDTLGWIYFRKGLPELAIRPISESTQKDPKNAIYQYHLGLAYAKTGNKAAARQALERALALDANFDGAADARTTLAALKG
jgi:tetratricopeptide (TPR) repeat protein